MCEYILLHRTYGLYEITNRSLPNALAIAMLSKKLIKGPMTMPIPRI